MSEQPLSDAATESSKPVSPGVVVGIDGSGGAMHALKWAAERADRFGPIQPVITWRYPWWAYTAPIPPPSADFKKLAELDADATVKSLQGYKPLDSIICRAPAGPALIDIGASARLIVVGTRGRSGLKDGLLGSVSSYVAAHATVPVAIVPNGAPIEDRYMRVVVGVDRSVSSLTALMWAVKNSPPGAMIEAIHTWRYASSTTLPPVSATAYNYYEEQAQYVLNEAIRAVTKAVGTHQHRIVPCLEYGDARRVLKEKSTESDLLVLGARKLTGPKHVLLGSVATAMVHQPSVVTVVVPSLPNPARPR